MYQISELKKIFITYRWTLEKYPGRLPNSSDAATRTRVVNCARAFSVHGKPCRAIPCPCRASGKFWHSFGTVFCENKCFSVAIVRFLYEFFNEGVFHDCMYDLKTYFLPGCVL